MGLGISWKKAAIISAVVQLIALFIAVLFFGVVPAIQEMDKNYELNLTYFDVFDAHDTAKKLKWMEVNFKDLKAILPTQEKLSHLAYNNHGLKYWEVVRNLL